MIAGTLRRSAVFVALALTACGGRTPLESDPLNAGTRAGSGGGGAGSGDTGASGGAGSGGAGTGAMPPGPGFGAVKGTVVDVEGRVYPGVELRLGSATAVSDGEGRFQFASAPAIYDVSAVLYRQGIYLYQGLSRRDPTLRIFDRYSLENPSRHAQATVNMPSGDTDTIKAVTFFELTDAVTFNSYNFNKVDAATTFHVFWEGAESVGIRLHAVQYEIGLPTSAPKRILAYDTADRRLAQEGSIDWTPVWKAAPFATGTISAQASVPPDYLMTGAQLYIRPSDHGPSFAFSELRQSEPLVSLLVPSMPGVTFDVEVFAGPRTPGTTSRRAVRLTPEAPAPLLELERAPSLDAPATDATGVGVGTTLRWTNPTGRPAYVRMHAFDEVKGTSLIYYVVTGGNSVVIPDMADRGIVFPSRAKGEWAVFSSSCDTVDDLAAYGRSNPELPQRTEANSSYRSFTTK